VQKNIIDEEALSPKIIILKTQKEKSKSTTNSSSFLESPQKIVKPKI